MDGRVVSCSVLCGLSVCLSVRSTECSGGVRGRWSVVAVGGERHLCAQILCYTSTLTAQHS